MAKRKRLKAGTCVRCNRKMDPSHNRDYLCRKCKAADDAKRAVPPVEIPRVRSREQSFQAQFGV